ncbi:MAG: hypothetical protein HN728_06305 [Flavobacteriales bacterium]|jgi:nucleoid-associated protein YgaU|nr:hypothetical protein [Flavobacteriales bacterium]MBT6916013.1 hypothetical protein [Flavobacteriales bacterium]MBT7749434.1 hypothetical protein [Flavobacteriales bacterium]NCG29637.1 hypothetical protein [Bacteroidota bacterium]
MSGGKLQKLVIKGYEDPEFKDLVANNTVSGDKRGNFELQVNPTDYKITMSTPPTTPTSETLANGRTINKVLPPEERTMNLKFHLDSTGVIPGITSVHDSVSDLKWLCIDLHGDVHDSYFLQLYWNKLVFNCKCQSLEIDYVLFRPSGEPVRAVINATFKEYIDAKKKELLSNMNSPDMTHLHTIKAGDSLPALCHRIYGDPKYYLQVAQANNIVNFRDIPPGKKVLFPRLEK